MSVRAVLIVLNVVAIVVIVAIVGYRVVSLRRNPESKQPENLTPFYDDNVLESRKLDRVLGTALWCSVILAAALPIYWLLEPTRQEEELAGFDERSVERGATLYANEQMEEYDSAVSLGCATCHGTDLSGGSAPFVLTPTYQGNEAARPVQVQWRAPALNTAALRFDDDALTNVLTYGRPGTPMPAWGLDGGGPKNEQAIQDLVSFINHEQISSDEAVDESAAQVDELLEEATLALETALDELAAAEQARAEAATPEGQAAAETDVLLAQAAVTNSQSRVTEVTALRAIAESTDAQQAQIAEGALLFQTNCARCHTYGWSYENPADARVPLPGEQGGGAFGPSLVDGATLDQFPGEPGLQKHIEWVTNGAAPNAPYGNRGISSGRMPHFSQTLTAEQIEAIVAYERTL